MATSAQRGLTSTPFSQEASPFDRFPTERDSLLCFQTSLEQGTRFSISCHTGMILPRTEESRPWKIPRNSGCVTESQEERLRGLDGSQRWQQGDRARAAGGTQGHLSCAEPPEWNHSHRRPPRASSTGPRTLTPAHGPAPRGHAHRRPPAGQLHGATSSCDSVSCQHQAESPGKASSVILVSRLQGIPVISMPKYPFIMPNFYDVNNSWSVSSSTLSLLFSKAPG